MMMVMMVCVCVCVCAPTERHPVSYCRRPSWTQTACLRLTFLPAPLNTAVVTGTHTVHWKQQLHATTHIRTTRAPTAHPVHTVYNMYVCIHNLMKPHHIRMRAHIHNTHTDSSLKYLKLSESRVQNRFFQPVLSPPVFQREPRLQIRRSNSCSRECTST